MDGLHPTYRLISTTYPSWMQRTVAVPLTYWRQDIRGRRNNLTFSLRAIVSADCFTRNLKTFLRNAALCFNILCQSVSIIKLLGALVVPLGQQRVRALTLP